MTVFRARRIVEVRRADLIPCDLLACVARDLPHHGNLRAGNHVGTAVHGLTRTNARKEHVVFTLVGITAALPAPFRLSPNPATHHRGLALGPGYDTGVLIVAASGGSAKGIEGHAVVKFINGRVMIKHIAVYRCCHGRPSPQTVAFHRILVVHDPSGTVQVVYEGLHEIVP